MDWIKVRSDVDRCEEVIRLSLALNVSVFEAVGLCVVFWAWADRNTDDGYLPKCTPEVVDQAIGRMGFAVKLIEVGWLLVDGKGLIVPNFDRHMGESAKQRALHAERSRRWREKHNKK